MSESLARWIQAVGTLFIGAALLIGVIAARGLLVTGGKDRTLTVSGKASRSIAPNESTISGSFEETATNQEDARKKAKDKATSGLTALKELGVEEKKIMTTNVSVYPDYDYSAKTQKITGYRAATALSVTLEDTAKAEPVIDTLIKSGAKSTSGPSLGFTSATKEAIIRELKLQAITDAKNQADVLAKQSGAKLGKVLSIGEGYESPENPPLPYGSARDLATEVAPAGGDIAIGEKEIIVNVSVSYQLR